MKNILIIAFIFCHVHTAFSATLEREEKASLIKAALAEQLGGNGAVVYLDNTVVATAVAAQNPTYHVEDINIDSVQKRFNATLAIKNDKGSTTEVLDIAGRYSQMISVPVLTRAMQTNAIVTSQDISSLEIAEEKLNANTITEPEKLIGMAVRRSLPAQRMLMSSDVAAPKIIKKGDLISMLVRTPQLSLTVQGRALSDGSMHDSIRAINLNSKKIIEGVITSSGTIEVPTSLDMHAQIVMQSIEEPTRRQN